MIRSANACKVYALVDETGRVQAINSSAFLRDTEGWTQIDEGEGDRYRHAQGNYAPKPIRDSWGVCRYKLVDGALVERTQEEMDAERVMPDSLTMEARVETLEEQSTMLTECLLEMSEAVYA